MTDSSAIMNTYGPSNVGFSHGEGVWLIDHDGHRYLDALAGIAVNTLGYAHPRLTQAMREQVGRLIHCSNLFDMPLQRKLASMLAERTGMENAFFCNSGLEANEAAIKLARLYGHRKGISRPEIIVCDDAFHGRSMATLSATANPKVQEGFAPLLDGFVRVPLNDIDRLKQVAADNPNVVAVFFETIQGEGGIHRARIDYLKQVRELCDQQNWLMMLDEIQCGTGRTGKWFAHHWADILADVVPIAKGLGSGMPVAALLARGEAAQVFQPGNHGTTFGGNPLAMRAAIATLEAIDAENLLANAATVGTWLLDSFERSLAHLDGVIEVRGQGLMIGIELDRNCVEICKLALAAGVVLNVTAGNVVRFLPPLIMSQAEAELLHERVVPVITAFLSK